MVYRGLSIFLFFLALKELMVIGKLANEVAKCYFRVSIKIGKGLLHEWKCFIKATIFLHCDASNLHTLVI